MGCSLDSPWQILYNFLSMQPIQNGCSDCFFKPLCAFFEMEMKGRNMKTPSPFPLTPANTYSFFCRNLKNAWLDVYYKYLYTVHQIYHTD